MAENATIAVSEEASAPGIWDALFSLYPGKSWVLNGNGYADLEWNEQTLAKPTEAALQAEVERLKTQREAERIRQQKRARIDALVDAGEREKATSNLVQAMLFFVARFAYEFVENSSGKASKNLKQDSTYQALCKILAALEAGKIQLTTSEAAVEEALEKLTVISEALKEEVVKK